MVGSVLFSGILIMAGSDSPSAVGSGIMSVQRDDGWLGSGPSEVTDVRWGWTMVMVSSSTSPTAKEDSSTHRG